MRTVLGTVGGGAVTLIGIVPLVLPGPGFILVAAGLSILANRFGWAAGPLQLARGRARAGMVEVGRSRRRALVPAAAAAGLTAVGALALAGVAVPLVSGPSAVLLVASGVAFMGTVAHARRRPGF